MLKSNNFQHYKLSTLSFLNIKIPSFSFLKKAILGLYKNLFWHISRKIGKILENFQKVPFKALLKQQKIFSKSLMKMDRFPKKIFLLKNKIKSISGVFCHMWPSATSTEVEKVKPFTQATFLGPTNLHQKVRDSRQIQCYSKCAIRDKSNTKKV